MMKRFKLIFIGVLALMLCTTGMANAILVETIALTFTGGTTYGAVATPYPNTIGWEFQLSAPITVTSLGFYDMDGDGLVKDHNVAIWDAGKNQLASAVVTNTDSLDQGFRWAALSSWENLAAGTYRIGALVAVDGSNHDDYYYSSTGSRTTAFPVSYIGGTYLLGSWGYPEDIGYTNNGRFGPNFKFFTSAVPIPPTLWLLGLGLLSLFGFKRKFK